MGPILTRIQSVAKDGLASKRRETNYKKTKQKEKLTFSVNPSTQIRQDAPHLPVVFTMFYLLMPKLRQSRNAELFDYIKMQIFS